MRVLHVIDALGVGGGAEHSLATMLPLLRERGIESSIVCIHPRQGGLQEQLRSEGFDVHVLESRTWPGRVVELRRHTARLAPDLVHATLVHSCFLARAAGIGSKVPLLNSIVTTSYDPVRLERLRIAPWKLHLLRLVDGLTVRHLVDHVHVLTEALRTEAVEVLGVEPSRLTVIPRGRSAEVLGVRTQERRARTRRNLGIDEDAPIVLNVGRQDSQKAQDTLVRGFAEVLPKHPDALLLIAGREGDSTARIRQALDETGVEGSVRLLGHRTDVADLLAAADLFAFPSRYEGLGCSLIEAMALEAPIIGSDAAAIDEVLESGRIGVVVPRDDPASLGRALSGLLADPARREELARAAHDRFLERYDIDHVAAATVQMYRRVASN